MEWRKQGLIYAVDGRYEWNQSHAQVPVVDMVDEDTWRIYFATRDAQSRSCTSFIEVEAGNPSNIRYVHDRPILRLGRPGCFDDCGAMPSWVTTVGDKKYLYYIGWTVRSTIPYHNSIGLAISSDGGRVFERFSEGPLFSPTWREPYFTGTSCVIVEDGLWRNYYLSCTKWEDVDGKLEPFYHLKYAESDDGIDWRREGVVAIDYATPDEGGIVKASVLRSRGGLWEMWYSHRNGRAYRSRLENSYRIGYAVSDDGRAWSRRDHLVGLDVSPEGWDEEMLAYPHVVEHNGTRYLFYNGNGFGKSGFGYAVET